jgi:alanine racemase
VRAGPIATIDLGIIADNYRVLQRICGAADVAATIKADAYGLGAKRIAQTLYKAGCRSFYVAHFEEALAIRTLHADTTVFVLHGIPANTEAEAHANNITPIITDFEALERITALGKKLEKNIAINLHRDTGMNRIGFSASEWDTLIATPDKLNGCDVTWVMSHFACSDEPQHPMNEQQYNEFIRATKLFPSAKKTLANSHGIFLGKQMHFDQVRPGRALSGIGTAGTGTTFGLKNALALHAPIIQLRSIDSDCTVGYGATQRVEKSMRLAALAYGYADGLHRASSNTDQTKDHHFYLHGIAVPIIGRISMDLVMVDVSKVAEHLVNIGDRVEIVGEHQSVDDFAAQIGTIGYELMTHMGHRVERNYIDRE